MLSMTKLLIIALIVFAIFGAGKLPKVMGDLGRGMRSLKEGFNGDDVKPDAPAERLEAQRDEAVRDEAVREEVRRDEERRS